MILDHTLYLVTDPAMTATRTLTSVVREAVAGGVTLVQVRDKAAAPRQLARVVTQLREAGVTVPIIINDSVQAVQLCDADGVHLGQSDAHPQSARETLGDNAIIGLSTTTAEQVKAAAELPTGTVDYLGVGPVWATGTKLDHDDPVGIAGISAMVAGAGSLPCVAIGGVQPGVRARQLRGLGLAGICVVSAICAAPHPRAAAEQLRKDWGADPEREQ